MSIIFPAIEYGNNYKLNTSKRMKIIPKEIKKSAKAMIRKTDSRTGRRLYSNRHIGDILGISYNTIRNWSLE